MGTFFAHGGGASVTGAARRPVTGRTNAAAERTAGPAGVPTATATATASANDAVASARVRTFHQQEAISTGPITA